MSARLVGLGVLDGYAVRWSRETVVRDVVQNFFDEAEDFADVVIDVDDERERVHVEGPSRVALDYLRYLGATTKQDEARRSAGGFGEGFKICALVLSRDYGAVVSAGSGSYRLRVSLEPMKLGRELCFWVEETPPHPGSFVTIERADARLREAFRGARSLFRWPGNPRLEKPLVVDESRGVGVYEAVDPHVGEVFYRRQLRGRVRFDRGAGVVLCHDGRIAELDTDRDRRDVRALAPLMKSAVAALDDDALLSLLRRLRPYWLAGHRLLTVVAREAGRRGLRVDAPPRWVAKTNGTPFELPSVAEQRGYRVACTAMALVGVPAMKDVLAGAEKPRAPTPLEHARFELARALYAELTGRRAPGERILRVLDVAVPEIHGGDERVAVVSARHLAGGFEEGIGPCLCALARGSWRHKASDGDRLTALLEGVLRAPRSLAPFAASWESLAMDLGALPPPPEHEGPAESLDGVWCGVLAPPGLAAAEALRARVADLARRYRIPLCWQRDVVCGPNDARFWIAYGVPTLVIGSIVVGKKPGARVGYYPSLVAPRDDEIVAALREMRGLRGRSGLHWATRLTRERRRIAARRRKKDPAFARDEARRDQLRALIDDVPLERFDVATMARTLLSRVPEELEPAAAAAQAVREAERTRGELDAWVAAEALGPRAVQRARAHMQQLAERGAASAEALRPWAEVWRALEERIDTAELDKTCADQCFAHGANDVAPADAPVEDRVIRALERLDAAIALARSRHDERDEWGEPLSCWGLGPLLHQDSPERASAEHPARAAVERAWSTALSAGAGEGDALAAALTAALPFDRATLW